MKNQEAIEIEEQEAHEEGQCEGAPECGYCLDEIRAAKREASARAERWALRILDKIDHRI